MQLHNCECHYKYNVFQGDNFMVHVCIALDHLEKTKPERLILPAVTVKITNKYCYRINAIQEYTPLQV